MRLIIAAAALAAFAGAAQAVTLSDSQPVTVGGQLFEFDFSPVDASNGNSGTFTLILDSDYSPGSPTENATLTFDGVTGNVVADESGEVSNTITGLTLLNATITNADFNDVNIQLDYAVTASLVQSIVAGGAVGINVQNSTGVDFLNQANPDFVSVDFTYNEITAVPLPPAMALMLVGIAGIGFIGRRRR